MTVPEASDPRWRDMAQGKLVRPWATLAMRIMMRRILASTAADPSPANVKKCASEIHSFFTKNAVVAEVDLRAILS